MKFRVKFELLLHVQNNFGESLPLLNDLKSDFSTINWIAEREEIC